MLMSVKMRTVITDAMTIPPVTHSQKCFGQRSILLTARRLQRRRSHQGWRGTSGPLVGKENIHHFSFLSCDFKLFWETNPILHKVEKLLPPSASPALLTAVRVVWVQGICLGWNFFRWFIHASMSSAYLYGQNDAVLFIWGPHVVILLPLPDGVQKIKMNTAESVVSLTLTGKRNSFTGTSTEIQRSLTH